MKLDLDIKNPANRSKMEISEVIRYRLAGSLVTEEEKDPSEQASQQEDVLSAASGPISPDSDQTCNSQEKRDLKPPLDGWRLSAALSEQGGDAIVESAQDFSHYEANNFESCVEKPKRFSKTLKAACSLILILFTASAAYLLGKNYIVSTGPQAISQDGVVEAQPLVIQGKNGQLRAWISERDGMFWLELRDAAGKAQISLSLSTGDEPKLSLYNKDQQKLSEWGWAEAKAPVGENSDKTVASPSIPENASVDKAVVPSSVSESVGAPEDTVAPVRYVGSKTSNKYHYPHCKWVNLIKPERLLTFSSVKEAKDNGNYVRCPTCGPPHTDEMNNAESGEKNNAEAPESRK